MAVTIVTAERRDAGSKVAYKSSIKVSFGAAADEQIVTHADDPNKVRQVTILDANNLQIAPAANTYSIDMTADGETVIKNLTGGAAANITIIVAVNP